MVPSNGSRMLTPNALSGPAPSIPAVMIPGPAPVTIIHPRDGQLRGEPARLLVERVVLLRPRRPEDRGLARRAVRGEHRECVPHLLERAIRDLQITAIRIIFREPQRGGDHLEDQLAAVARPHLLDEVGDLRIELGIAGAIARQLHRVQRPASAASAARSVCGRGPRWEITSAAATPPSRPQVARSRAGREPVQHPRRIQVARSRRVDDRPPGTLSTGTRNTSSPCEEHRAVGAVGDGGDVAVVPDQLDRRIERIHLVEHLDLGRRSRTTRRPSPRSAPGTCRGGGRPRTRPRA